MTKQNNTAKNLIASRSVHRALAVTVELQGIDQAKNLYAKALEFNKTYFAGSLLPVVVMIAAPASPSALATHEHRTPEGVDSLVKIAPSVVVASEKLALDALLHEMVHISCHEAGQDETGYEGHGPVFAAKCNEIGKALGLPEVGVKGRDGLPNCAQWPLNVRPEGYYGFSVKATKAVAKARKTGAPKVKGAKVKRAPKVNPVKRAAAWKALAKKYRAELKALKA
jgi:hypothetical protein